MSGNLTKRADKGIPINIAEYDEVVQCVIDLLGNLITLSDAWSLGGLNVRAYATNAPILDQYVSNAGATITIAVADVTFGREDSVVIDIQGNISIIQGTPGAVVIPPTIDPDVHYLIRNLLIPANATEPVDPNTGAGNTNVKTLYAEVGTEVGGETDVTASHPTIVINSTNTPLNGTKSIEATDVEKNHYTQYSFGTVQKTEEKTHFRFKLKLKAAVPTNRNWYFRLLLGTSQVNFLVFSHGKYGFNANITTEQNISVPLADFGVSNIDFDSIVLFFFHSLNTISGYWLDDVEMLVGYSTTTQTTDTETFNATEGQIDFILSTTPKNVDVYVDRLYQILTVDYTIVNNTITLTESVSVGSIVSIRKF